MPEIKTNRLNYIDNIRTFLISAIILLHLAITYGAPGGWYYHEVSNDDIDIISKILYGLFNATIQAFSLGLFFMISGYFTAASYERKGARKFIKDRFLRLGIPLLFYVVIINPPLIYIINKFARGQDISFWTFIVGYFRTTNTVGAGPLWFVIALLLFSIIYSLWRFITKNTFDSSRFKWDVPGNAAIAGFALMVGLMSFTVRIWLPVFWSFELLGFQFPHFSQYICFFIAGIWAFRGNWFEKVSDKSGTLWIKITLLLIFIFSAIIYLSGAAEGDQSIFGGLNLSSFSYSLWEQFMCAGMAVGLPVLFRKKFNYNGRLAQSLSASTYTVYIIHAPVIVLFCLALKNISMHHFLKFILVAPFAVSLCFFLANIIRKLPLARKIL
ncbi:acyltransferase family protein [Candidatus Latescibacterota bacterium]